MYKAKLFRAASKAAVLGALTAVGALSQAAGAQETVATNTGQASDTNAAEQDADRVVITGSRVATNGFEAPTPVTTLSADELKTAAPTILESLRLLPQLTGSNSPIGPGPTTGGGPQTNDTSNLRNLGSNRTLVLLDGRRPTPSGSTGVPDLSMLPMSLVSRVDVVTGGASAAYGSDAVAGAVNFILDTDFEGLKLETRGGISSRGDGGSGGIELAAGGKFLDDKLSVIAGLTLNTQNGITGDRRPWTNAYWAALPNPNTAAGQPQLILRRGVRLGNANFTGVITTPGPLFDITFTPNGTPIPFIHGTEVRAGGTLEVGGDGGAYVPDIASNVNQGSLFAHANYDLSDGISIFAEGSYAESQVEYENLIPFNLGTGGYLILADNAFLPASIRSTMLANNIPSFRLGKFDENIGKNRVKNYAYTATGTVGLNADLPGGFELTSYYTHGESLLHYGAENQKNQVRSRLAIDAVVNPANGRIVCRSTLTAPTNGCVPFNPFGSLPLTETQRAYLTGESRARSLTIQDVVAADIRGDLFSTWAGPVSVAAGAEYRRLSTKVVGDPTSLALQWNSGNVGSSSGKYTVTEGFAEVLVPLARDLPLAQELDLNAAVRSTDYSTSGRVTTWKVGLTDQVVDDLRLRATYSQDIRAPNITELFGSRTRSIGTVRDPVFNNVSVTNIFTFSGSNSALQPEVAKTLTAGFSYRPSWTDGLGVSVDYYSIDIDDAITAPTIQNVVDQCFQGNQAFCSLVVRDSSNNLTQITATLQNISQLSTSGFDFEVDYNFDALGGVVSLRGLATYVDKLERIIPGVTPVEAAGVSQPHWRGTLQAGWRQGPLSISVQERYVGPYHRTTPPITIDYNDVPAVFYTNLNLRYELDFPNLGNPELFLSINNLFDKAPPVGVNNNCPLGWCGGQFDIVHDRIGRYFTTGFRAAF